MAVVIDDHLLLGLLAGLSPDAVSEETQGDVVYTTGCWYYRLARAVRTDVGSGSLTRRFEELDPGDRERALRALQELPQTIGLLSYRSVVPVMAALRVRRPLNMLNAEAVAVALIVDGRLRTAVTSDLLRSGAEDLGINYRVVS